MGIRQVRFGFVHLIIQEVKAGVHNGAPIVLRAPCNYDEEGMYVPR